MNKIILIVLVAFGLSLLAQSAGAAPARIHIVKHRKHHHHRHYHHHRRHKV
ncbi:MAG TPA: hypothetical protein VGN23_09960 [Verrucomicrobiae bacterium]|jgi:hypothetical protein